MTMTPPAAALTAKRRADFVPPSLAFPTRTLTPGDVLYEAGGEAKLLYLVDDGVLTGVVPTSLDRERVADLYGPGDLLGVAALGGGVHAETVVALNEAVLIPLGPRYLLTDERLSRYILRNLAEQIGRSRLDVAESELPVGARLAQLLLHLGERFGYRTKGNRVRLSLSLTHDDLAAMTRSSRVTVTRMMGELRGERAVFGTRGAYEIDPVRLEAAAEHYVLQVL